MSHEKTTRTKHRMGYFMDEFDGEHFDFSKVGRDVKYLTIRNAKTVDFSMINYYGGIQHLEIQSDNLEELDLSPLKEASRLDFFRLSAPSLSELDLSPVSHVNAISITSKFSVIDLSELEQSTSEPHDKVIDLRDCSGRTFSPVGIPNNMVSFRVGGCRELKTLDISPIADNKQLRHIAFEDNALEQIDLTPFSSCEFDPVFHATTLRLCGNNLTSVDLRPLSGLQYLRELHIVNNKQLKHIDLSPLTTCSRLTYIRLNGNPLEEIDVSPLFEIPYLAEVIFAVEGETYPRIVADKRYKDTSSVYLQWLDNARAKDSRFVINYV